MVQKRLTEAAKKRLRAGRLLLAGKSRRHWQSMRDNWPCVRPSC